MAEYSSLAAILEKRRMHMVRAVSTTDRDTSADALDISCRARPVECVLRRVAVSIALCGSSNTSSDLCHAPSTDAGGTAALNIAVAKLSSDSLELSGRVPDCIGDAVETDSVSSR